MLMSSPNSCYNLVCYKETVLYQRFPINKWMLKNSVGNINAITSMISNKASTIVSNDDNGIFSCSGGDIENDRSPGRKLVRKALTAADLTLLIPNNW